MTVFTAHSWQRGTYVLAHVDGCAKIRARDRTDPPPDRYDAWPCSCRPYDAPSPAQLALCERRGILPARTRTGTRLRLDRSSS